MNDISTTIDPTTKESAGPRLTAAEFLEKILRERVFKSGDLPNRAAIAKLASRLRGLRGLIEARKSAIQLDKERQQKIRAALDVLIELLPEARKEREKQEPLNPATCQLDSPTVRETIATIDTLNSAAVYARVHLLFGPELVLFSPFTEEWKDSAKVLYKIFKEISEKQSDEAAYRFVQEIVPYLTGEAPGYDAVRSAFFRNRLVNRGKSQRPLP
jgi:hypothetical protein